MAGYPRIRDIIGKSPAYLIKIAGLSEERVHRVQEYLRRYGLTLEGGGMTYTDKELSNGFVSRCDYLRGFPFGMDVYLIDDRGCERVKYVYDLNNSSEEEAREAITMMNRYYSDNGIHTLDDAEERKLEEFIYNQGEVCRQEWKKTFDIEL